MKLRVVRSKDTVEVLIANKKDTQMFQFINLTKGHICPCEFTSIEDALKDLDKYIELGKVISYEII